MSTHSWRKSLLKMHLHYIIFSVASFLLFCTYSCGDVNTLTCQFQGCSGNTVQCRAGNSSAEHNVSASLIDGGWSDTGHIVIEGSGHLSFYSMSAILESPSLYLHLMLECELLHTPTDPSATAAILVSESDGEFGGWFLAIDRLSRLTFTLRVNRNRGEILRLQTETSIDLRGYNFTTIDMVFLGASHSPPLQLTVNGVSQSLVTLWSGLSSSDFTSDSDERTLSVGAPYVSHSNPSCATDDNSHLHMIVRSLHLVSGDALGDLNVTFDDVLPPAQCPEESAVCEGNYSRYERPSNGICECIGMPTDSNSTICGLDVQAPSISLIGSNIVVVVQGDSYVDEGVEVMDNVDDSSDIDVTSTGLPVDTSTVGTFTVTYTAVDTTGNSNQLSRTVIVTDFDECVAETHNCHDEAYCFNTNGTFECHCNSSNSYIGDGLYCEPALGKSESNPALSCVQIYDQWFNVSAEGELESSTYWIQPITLSSPVEIYCDMVNDGGGWALAVVIDGNDHDHSEALSVGALPILPGDMNVSTKKLSDEVINALLWYPAYGAIRFMCDSITHFVKDCHWRATKGLPSNSDPCVTLYADPAFTSVQDNTAGNHGSGGVGSHVDDPSGQAHVYCSHCRGADAYTINGGHRYGCGHDSSGYAKKGRLWVRPAVSDGCTVSQRTSAGCDSNAYCQLDGSTPTCKCNIGLGYIGSGTSCQIGRGNLKDSPASNCQDVLDQRTLLGLPTPWDGQYWLQPVGISSPFLAYCRFEGTAGWTLVVSISGVDENHSNVEQVAGRAPMMFDYAVPLTRKFDDVRIQALLTESREDASIKFICDGYTHYLKNCEWRATKGLDTPGPCVNLYSNVAATTLQSNRVCNDGSGALGSHCNAGSNPPNSAHTYCSHCDRADGEAHYNRNGCGHDQVGYGRNGFVWVR